VPDLIVLVILFAIGGWQNASANQVVPAPNGCLADRPLARDRAWVIVTYWLTTAPTARLNELAASGNHELTIITIDLDREPRILVPPRSKTTPSQRPA
jgi:hypothetical protein